VRDRNVLAEEVHAMRRSIRVLALATLSTLLLAAPAVAAKPTMERVAVDDLFVDDFLSEVCGTEVRGHVTGHIVFRAFTDAAGATVRELNNYALTAQFISDQATIRAKDVGVDRVTYQPDGSIVNVIVGNVQSIQLPGLGRVYSDVGQITIHITFDENGEPSVELLDSAGQHDDDQLDVLCEVLAG
jgi:hypothetical protein